MTHHSYGDSQLFRVLGEAVRIFSVQKARSNFVGGWVQGGDNLDNAEQTAQAVLHIAQAQDGAEIF
jgi:hypothetical protein